jgi:hypothetical protein
MKCDCLVVQGESEESLLVRLQSGVVHAARSQEGDSTGAAQVGGACVCSALVEST